MEQNTLTPNRITSDDHATVSLPEGFTVSVYDELPSTNSTALELAMRDNLTHHWIWAKQQTQGRGRNARLWQGGAGNLTASLVLRPKCDIAMAAQLSLLAGVAAYDALSSTLSSRKNVEFFLKWPNDLLLDHAKIGGILLESQKAQAHSDFSVVIGTGLNLAWHPDLPERKTTSLSAYGIEHSAYELFLQLARSTAYWLAVWDNGLGFQAIRRAWLDRAQPLGTELQIHISDVKEQGYFCGLDEQGALIFETRNGEQKVIQAGDVFIIKEFKEIP